MTVAEAVLVPVPDGVNFMLTEQLEPTATAALQVLLSLKSEAFAPPILTPNTVKGAFPVFEIVTDCAELGVVTSWFGNVSPLEDRFTAGLTSDGPTLAINTPATELV